MDNTEVKIQKSFRWVCTIGSNKGYELSEQKRMTPEKMSHKYLKSAEEVLKENGIYISAVMTESRTLYNAAWGCPPKGEYSYTFSGSCNRNFAEPDEYRRALRVLIERLKKHLGQSTVLLEIIPAELEYFTD